MSKFYVTHLVGFYFNNHQQKSQSLLKMALWSVSKIAAEEKPVRFWGSVFVGMTVQFRNDIISLRSRTSTEFLCFEMSSWQIPNLKA